MTKSQNLKTSAIEIIGKSPYLGTNGELQWSQQSEALPSDFYLGKIVNMTAEDFLLRDFLQNKNKVRVSLFQASVIEMVDDYRETYERHLQDPVNNEAPPAAIKTFLDNKTNPRFYTDTPQILAHDGIANPITHFTGASMMYTEINRDYKSTPTHQAVANESDSSNDEDDNSRFVNVKRELSSTNLRSLTPSDFSELLMRYMSQEDPRKSTPIILLARTLQNEELLNLLNEAERRGMDADAIGLNLQDKDGRGVLHYAYGLGNGELVERLETFKGIKLDLTDNREMTPQNLAASLLNNPEGVHQLLADVEMHPDRDEKAKSNAIMDEKTLQRKGVDICFLQNKEVLEELLQLKDLPKYFRAKIKDTIQEFTGRSLGEKCVSGLRELCNAFSGPEVVLPKSTIVKHKDKTPEPLNAKNHSVTNLGRIT